MEIGRGNFYKNCSAPAGKSHIWKPAFNSTLGEKIINFLYGKLTDCPAPAGKSHIWKPAFSIS